ncbi:MAG TPA: FAD-binding oxidoreductase [Polyangiaceae bacterium]|nr:FAD-binding oxidoreductase [Polyangiaceae bacterium]
MLDDIDDNASVWVAGKPAYQPLPPLAGDTSADVAIIGGGFTGVSTAWHLARRFPERRILLLEAKTLGNGGSGRNGGLVLNWINGVHSPDAEHARGIYEVTQRGMRVLESMIETHALKVPYDKNGSLEVLTDPRRAEEAARWAEEMRAVGVPLEFVTELDDTLRMQGARGALFDPRSGRLDGIAMLRAMRDVLIELGVGVHENTPVLAVREGQEVALTTAQGEVRAKAIVLATNAYTRRLGYFRDVLFSLHSHVIATEPRSAEEWKRMGWAGVAGFNDDLDRIAYGCLTQSGQMVFGGGSNDAYSYRIGGRTALPRTPERGFAAVERRMRAYFPDAADVPIAHRWSGALAITMSRLCAMGVRGDHQNVYYAFGYSGHGITLAHLAGEVLCDIYAGDDARWRTMPFYQPRLFRMPPEPLRWMGYQIYTRFTGRSPRRVH